MRKGQRTSPTGMMRCVSSGSTFCSSMCVSVRVCFSGCTGVREKLLKLWNSARDPVDMDSCNVGMGYIPMRMHKYRYRDLTLPNGRKPSDVASRPAVGVISLYIHAPGTRSLPYQDTPTEPFSHLKICFCEDLGDQQRTETGQVTPSYEAAIHNTTSRSSALAFHVK